MSIIWAVRRLRRKDLEFKASLSYIGRVLQKKREKEKKNLYVHTYSALFG
jgi:hypothetical protein